MGKYITITIHKGIDTKPIKAYCIKIKDKGEKK